MPGMWITEYHDFQFDSAKFTVTQNGKQTDQTIEGRKVVIDYATIRGGAQISMLQIIRNLQNAVRTAGGQVIDDSEGTIGITHLAFYERWQGSVGADQIPAQWLRADRRRKGSHEAGCDRGCGGHGHKYRRHWLRGHLRHQLRYRQLRHQAGLRAGHH